MRDTETERDIETDKEADIQTNTDKDGVREIGWFYTIKNAHKVAVRHYEVEYQSYSHSYRNSTKPADIIPHFNLYIVHEIGMQ